MPELPEVENVRLSLEGLGTVGQRVQRLELLRSGLRTPFDKALPKRLVGESVLGLSRRAKFLLFETEHYCLLSHLGMTGSWRQGNPGEAPGKHDHVILSFESGLRLIFNDPRRFGVLELVDKRRLAENRWLKHLGPEPLVADFDGDYLFKTTRKRKAPIKAVIMDQTCVVGVGNIYASEALFATGVKPTRAAGRVTRAECERLVEAIKTILHAAIGAGGSTIRDYRSANGEQGSFQQRFSVYDRNGQPCLTCDQPVKSKFIAGRNTYWCPKCQR